MFGSVIFFGLVRGGFEGARRIDFGFGVVVLTGLVIRCLGWFVGGEQDTR